MYIDVGGDVVLLTGAAREANRRASTYSVCAHDKPSGCPSVLLPHVQK